MKINAWSQSFENSIIFFEVKLTYQN